MTNGPLMLVINTNGTAHIGYLPSGQHEQLGALNDIVGGYIEAIAGTDTRWHAYLNEEGKLLGLPVNYWAWEVAVRHGWAAGGDFLAGNVVFLGDSALDGEEADVPGDLLETARELGLLA